MMSGSRGRGFTVNARLVYLLVVFGAIFVGLVNAGVSTSPG
jgi:hypothetical protein